MYSYGLEQSNNKDKLHRVTSHVVDLDLYSFFLDTHLAEW